MSDMLCTPEAEQDAWDRLCGPDMGVEEYTGPPEELIALITGAWPDVTDAEVELVLAHLRRYRIARPEYDAIEAGE